MRAGGAGGEEVPGRAVRVLLGRHASAAGMCRLGVRVLLWPAISWPDITWTRSASPSGPAPPLLQASEPFWAPGLGLQQNAASLLVEGTDLLSNCRAWPPVCISCRIKFACVMVSQHQLRKRGPCRSRSCVDSRAVCMCNLRGTDNGVQALLTFSMYVWLGRPLTTPVVFTSLALFNVLTAPLNSFPWVVNGCIEAVVSVRRLQR